MNTDHGRMEALLLALEQAQSDTAQTNDITKTLFQIQNDLNYNLLKGRTNEQIDAILGSIWRFLLFTAAHSASSVRLASYRTTGAFLLKITPFYPIQIQKSFSDVSMMSTIDLKSSAIIASAFAFISNTIALPYLEEFLDSTPVYHNFAISDPIFSEHLSSIIANLGRLGLDWFRTLLHSFLALVATSTDRYLIRSICSIVKHYPVELMNEILQFVREQESMKPYLALISFVLSSGLDASVFDLYDIAKHSLMILDSGSGNLTEIDSSLQILAINSPSFILNITEIDAASVLMTLQNGSGSESTEVKFSVAKYKNRPALYLLKLPFTYSRPDFEKDGALTLSAKFKSMAEMVNRNHEFASLLFALIEENMGTEYNDVASACMQAMAKCLPVLLEMCDRKTVVSILKCAVFSKAVSWFHAADILELIKAVPRDEISSVLGFSSVIEVLIDLYMSENEQLWKKACAALGNLVNMENFEDVTTQICNRMDIFDITSVVRSLSVLSHVMTLNPTASNKHLMYVVYQVLELCTISKNDLTVLTTAYEFLGHFEFVGVKTTTLRPVINKAFTIISADILEVSGVQWAEYMKPTKLQKSIDMVHVDFQSKNLDIVSEGCLDYPSCMKPLFSALKFISVMPVKQINPTFVYGIIQRSVYFFPLVAVNMMKTFWSRFSDNEKARLMNLAINRLRCTQDYAPVAVLCELFITSSQSTKKDLVAAQEKLTLIVKFALENKDFTTESEIVIFNLYMKFIGASPSVEYTESEIQKHSSWLYNSMFAKDSPVNEEPVVIQKVDRVFAYSSVTSELLTQKIDISSGIVKAQLRQSTREFTKDELQELFMYYSRKNDPQGIMLVLRYALPRRILLVIGEPEIPLKSAAAVVRYLKLVNSPELDRLAKKYAECDASIDAMCASISVDSSTYLNTLVSGERITKVQLRRLANVMMGVPFDNDLLLKTIMDCFEHARSKNKMPYMLVILGNYLTKVKSIPENSVVELFKILDEREELLSAVPLCCCLEKLCEIVPMEKRVSILRRFIPRFPVVSPMSVILHLALSKTTARATFDKEIPKITAVYLKKKQPSLFCGGLRLFARGLACMPDKRVQSLLKHGINRVVRNCPKFKHIFNCAEITGVVITSILTTPYLKKHFSAILSHADTLVVHPDHASFISMMLAVPHIILMTANMKPMIEVSKSMMKRVDELITRPASHILITVYLKIIGTIVERLHNDSEREMKVFDLASKWIEENLCDGDCPTLSDIVFEWCLTIHRYCKFAKMIPMVTAVFFRRTNRFFPVFCGVARFIAKLPTSNATKEELEQVKAGLIETGKVIELQCKAHGMALQLMNDKTTLRIAYDLAKFDYDCTESQLIINQIRPEQHEVGDLLVLDNSTSSFCSNPFLEQRSDTSPSLGDIFEPIQSMSSWNETGFMGSFDQLPDSTLAESDPAKRILVGSNLELFEALTPPEHVQTVIGSSPIESIPSYETPSLLVLDAPTRGDSMSSPIFEPITPPNTLMYDNNSSMFEPITPPVSMFSPSGPFEMIPPLNGGFERINTPNLIDFPSSPLGLPSEQNNNVVVDDLIDL